MHTSKPWLWEGQETYPGLYEKCIRVFAQNYYFPSTLIWKHSTSCRKHSEPIRSTGYKKTLRNPMERLYKRPLFMGGSLNTCTALFADKNTGPGGCDCSKRAVRVGAVKHTQSLRIHLMPISTLLWHTKTSGKRDPPTHPLLLASRGRSGPSYLHNCACMTLILPGKWETYTPLWTRIWHFCLPKMTHSSCLIQKSQRKWSFYCEIPFNLIYSSTHHTSEILFYANCRIQNCSLRCLFAFYRLC